MLRALLALGMFATAICGVKGAPRPPETTSLSRPADAADAGIPSGAIAPDATAIDPAAQDPLALDAGCADGGGR